MSDPVDDRKATTSRSARAKRAAPRADAAAPPAAAFASDESERVASHDFAPKLLAWFDRNGRHDLPWQHPRSPYRVWLSEVMLQQTQVRVVIPYFARFVAALPDVRALAAAPLDAVLALWSGLGYYARARNLHAGARACVERHGGELPRDFDALVALPGIGRSTAGAILSQAWGERAAILDGNVKRVLARVHGVEGWPGLPTVEKRLWAIADAQLDGVPAGRMADYTQAQMDFGATLCTRHDPACVLCPLQGDCTALREGRVDDLPTPKPGKPLPERQAVLLLLRDAKGRVLLQRRAPAGVWASLWSLPESAYATAARTWLETTTDARYDDARALDPIAHGFTHYHLRLQPLAWEAVTLRARIGEDDGLRWISRGELATLGIPAPIRKLLEAQL